MGREASSEDCQTPGLTRLSMSHEHRNSSSQESDLTVLTAIG